MVGFLICPRQTVGIPPRATSSGRMEFMGPLKRISWALKKFFMKGSGVVCFATSRRLKGWSARYNDRPARLSVILFRIEKLAEPESKNWSGILSLSTARLIAANISGHFCASSMVMGLLRFTNPFSLSLSDIKRLRLKVKLSSVAKNYIVL